MDPKDRARGRSRGIPFLEFFPYRYFCGLVLFGIRGWECERELLFEKIPDHVDIIFNSSLHLLECFLPPRVPNSVISHGHVRGVFGPVEMHNCFSKMALVVRRVTLTITPLSEGLQLWKC